MFREGRCAPPHLLEADVESWTRASVWNQARWWRQTREYTNSDRSKQDITELSVSLTVPVQKQQQSRCRILGRNPNKSLKSFSSLLFTVTSTASPWDFYFFKLMQPRTVSRVELLCTVKEKGRKPDWKSYTLPYGLRNPYIKLKSENSQDYFGRRQTLLCTLIM